MKSPAERKRDERTRMRSHGLVLKQIWVNPKRWPAIQKYLSRYSKG